MRLAMIVEYDGAGYSGFQYQKNAPTVQEQIENSIESLTAEPVRIKAAGRTDAGVHALGQVVAFDTEAPYPPETVRDALNARLPDDIAVRAVYRVRPDFDPRRDAVSRMYRFTLLVSDVRAPLARRCSHRVRGLLDLESMTQAAALMEGVHDFANFAGAMSDPAASTVRRVYHVSLERDSDFVRPGGQGQRLPASPGEADGRRSGRHWKGKIEYRTDRFADRGKCGRANGEIRSTARVVPGAGRVHGLPA